MNVLRPVRTIHTYTDCTYGQCVAAFTYCLMLTSDLRIESSICDEFKPTVAQHFNDFLNISILLKIVFMLFLNIQIFDFVAKVLTWVVKHS